MIEGGVINLLVEAAWKSMLVSGVALLLLALLKRRSAAERACAAHFGIAAVLAVPILVLFGPPLEVALLAPESATVLAAAPPGTQLGGPAPATPTAAEPHAPVIETAASMIDAETAMLLAYSIPAALLLLLTIVSILRLFALRGRATVIVQQGWLTALAHAQRRMGIKHGTALLASAELRSPVSWGILRPIILLNEEALDTPVDAEAIIAHELAHVARFDWLNLLAARVATALFWFNPLVWLLARHGHQRREEAADDAVLRANVPSAEYAALLVGAARHEGNRMLLAANGVAPGKASLSLRVRRILEPATRRGPARFAWGASCAAGALLVAGPLAALTSVPPPPPSPPAGLAAVSPPPPRPASASLLPRPGAQASASTAFAARAPGGRHDPAPPAPAGAAGAPTAPAPAQRAVMSARAITPDLVQAVAVADPGPSRLGLAQINSLRAQAVTPARLREWAALGYRNLDLDQVMAVAVHGVTPSDVRSLAALGYHSIPVDQLIAMRIHGVTPRFITGQRAGGRRRMSPEQLVEAAIFREDAPGPPRPPRGSGPPGRPRAEPPEAPRGPPRRR